MSNTPNRDVLLRRGERWTLNGDGSWLTDGQPDASPVWFVQAAGPQITGKVEVVPTAGFQVAVEALEAIASATRTRLQGSDIERPNARVVARDALKRLEGLR